MIAYVDENKGKFGVYVDENKGKFGVEPICELLPVAASTYTRRSASRRRPGARTTRS
jgi:hypothetical protein